MELEGLKAPLSTDSEPPKIRAIETIYAGCRFRSRLEARWAVFFDALHVRWEYEPQGFETRGGRYLPDFWLHDTATWIEVKGQITPADLQKLTNAVPDLSERRDGQIDHRLAILGPVPAPGIAWLHTLLSTLQRRRESAPLLLWSSSFWSPFGDTYGLITIDRPLIFDAGANFEDEADSFFCDLMLDPGNPATRLAYRLAVDPAVDDAYRAARSARFEFGESG